MRELRSLISTYEKIIFLSLCYLNLSSAMDDKIKIKADMKYIQRFNIRTTGLQHCIRKKRKN